MGFYCKLSCIGLLVILAGTTSCRAQKGNNVVYRDYTRMEASMLNSLKRDGVLPLFKGMVALRQQAQQVKESTPINMEPRRAEKRKMTPEEILVKRCASVLTVNKLLKNPEMVTGWATAVVLTSDGVCVSNFHVFWELLDPKAKLNPRDSVMFVATEDGRVYPITEILSFNKTADMAFFKIDTRGDVLTPMPLGNDLQAGANVHLLSNPEGYPYAYTHGRASRTIRLNPNDPFSNRMEMTADFAKGSSGGPIMDDRGNMVSMVSSIRAIYYSQQPPYNLQMNVKLTIPVSSFRRLMQKGEGR